MWAGGWWWRIFLCFVLVRKCEASSAVWREGGGASGPGPAREDQTFSLQAPTVSIEDKVISCQICPELLDINALTKLNSRLKKGELGLEGL